jgi:hypothetical protein
MGMEQAVTFSSGLVPAWTAVHELLTSRGYGVQMRMIDGELAFPDERPSEGWRELRVGTPGGMVAVRREPGRVVCVTFGNAQGDLLRAWNALAWAFAEAGGGRIDTAQGSQGADEYGRSADLPPELRPR